MGTCCCCGAGHGMGEEEAKNSNPKQSENHLSEAKYVNRESEQGRLRTVNEVL